MENGVHECQKKIYLIPTLGSKLSTFVNTSMDKVINNIKSQALQMLVVLYYTGFLVWKHKLINHHES
jgi:hypothetical protein